MSTRLLPRTLTTAAGVLLGLFPAISHGAQVPPEDPDELGRYVRAQALERAADGDLARAADELLRSIHALGVVGLERARSLALAGRLYHHAGNLHRAHRTMMRAGLAAYHAADPVLSVRLFLDAAQAAVEDGDAELAWRSAERAGYVIRTTDFTARQKLTLLGRVTYTDQVPVLQMQPPLATERSITDD